MDDKECIETNVYCAIQEKDKEFIENNCIQDYNVEFYFNEEKEIDFCTYPECRSQDFILDKMFDLITAGLVEKIEEV